MVYSLIVEVYVTKNKEFIIQLKDDSMFLLSDVEINLHDKPIEKYLEKHKYEQAISECKKLSSFIKRIVGRNVTVLSEKN